MHLTYNLYVLNSVVSIPHSVQNQWTHNFQHQIWTISELLFYEPTSYAHFHLYGIIVVTHLCTMKADS